VASPGYVEKAHIDNGQRAVEIVADIWKRIQTAG
jgi:hypothetical protein